jgi:hypothetical protein
MPQKIIVDADPGQDDALAILLAFGSPELEVLGITAVAGNVPLKLTQLNARKICELAEPQRCQGFRRRRSGPGAAIGYRGRGARQDRPKRSRFAGTQDAAAEGSRGRFHRRDADGARKKARSRSVR